MLFLLNVRKGQKYQTLTFSRSLPLSDQPHTFEATAIYREKLTKRQDKRQVSELRTVAGSRNEPRVDRRHCESASGVCRW